jgi:hypothetical protein
MIPWLVQQGRRIIKDQGLLVPYRPDRSPLHDTKLEAAEIDTKRLMLKTQEAVPGLEAVGPMTAVMSSK